ncbi:MAG: hypothetical protein K9J13_08055 [Saprospiraceae bacterium]|nr:hypothetical protein [Saprospiraceae bacterium]
MENDIVKKIEKVDSIKKNSNVGYKTTIVVLSLIIIALLYMLYVTKNEVQTIIVEKVQATNELQSELDSLLSEHNLIKQEYGEVSNQLLGKDSIIMANAEEIRKLIASQADYRRIKRKLDFLRGITQGYVNQIDSLFTVNRQLKDENVQITKKYQKEQSKTVELIQEKDVLTEKVEIASMLNAYNIEAYGVRDKGRKEKEQITDKANRVEKLKLCFTLSQNLLVDGGEKLIYVRITRPDNQILSKGKGDLYSFMFNGEMLQYSLKKVINYKNQSMNICMFWEKQNKDEAAMLGKYNFAIFVDGYEIGQTSIVLK